MKSRPLLPALTVAAATLFTCGLAQAGSIQTPTIFSFGGDQVVCIANNASNQTITVRVKIFGTGGSGTATETCQLAPNDADGCQAFKNNAGGFCRISVTGMPDAQVRQNVRGVLFSRDTNAPFLLRGLVQAQ
jgi:hypothetical protein